jgi:hypothetical protein
MAPIDPALFEKARPHFLTALASFGSPGDQPYRVVDRIIQEAAAAGFPPQACQTLHQHLRHFLGELLLSRLDPFLLGRPISDPSSLFAEDCLGGLFHPREEPPTEVPPPPTQESAEEDRERALLEQLIAATRLYETSKAVEDLIAFTIRLRAFAPFNAMILHIQKPGLTHAATAQEWWNKFGRVPKPGTRPLLIMRTRGPVDFVFDILDTHGRELPEGAFSFPTLGSLSEERFQKIITNVSKAGFEIVELDRGDSEAGWIGSAPNPVPPSGRRYYQLAFNRNHSLPTQLVTIAHELAHLFLGHLGEDKKRHIPDRRDRSRAEREVEAEMTAYLVAMRNGLKPRSESYLSTYKGAFASLDLYGVMRAANAVETAMGISSAQLKAEGEGRA